MTIPRIIVNTIKEKFIYVTITSLLLIVAVSYHYCYIAEHNILSFQQGKYTVTAKCKSSDMFTFTPYIDVKIKNLDIMTTAVNSGYDSLKDCMRSGVKSVQIDENERKVQILTEGDKIKEINLIYSPR